MSIHTGTTGSATHRHQHESDVRRIARELAVAVEALQRASADTPDLRRLVQDTGRVLEDVDLLLGAEAAAATETNVIPDGDYPPGFFGDAEDEGVGRHR